MEYDIDLSDLIEPYATIAELTDYDTAMKLARTFGGEQIYFPMPETIEKPQRTKKILKEFNGYNYRYLAKKYHISIRTVRRICGEIAEIKKHEPIRGQIDLFTHKEYEP